MRRRTRADWSAQLLWHLARGRASRQAAKALRTVIYLHHVRGRDQCVFADAAERMERVLIRRSHRVFVAVHGAAY